MRKHFRLARRPLRARAAAWPPTAQRGLLLALLALALALAVALWGPSEPGAQARSGRPAGAVTLAWGVGGVLTEDGTLWQFRPESRKWVTVDQSFALDGERRKVLPLPVPPREIADMEGFGFLVTKSGAAWIYNLDSNQWESIGAPRR